MLVCRPRYVNPPLEALTLAALEAAKVTGAAHPIPTFWLGIRSFRNLWVGTEPGPLEIRFQIKHFSQPLSSVNGWILHCVGSLQHQLSIWLQGSITLSTFMNNLNGTAARTYITGSTFGRSRFKEYQWNLTQILQDFLKTTRGNFGTTLRLFGNTWRLLGHYKRTALGSLGNSVTCWGPLEDHLGTTCGLFAYHLGTSTRSELFGITWGLIVNSTSDPLSYCLRTTWDY